MTPTIVCLVTFGVVAIVAVTAALRPIPLPIATGKFAWANMSGEAGQELGPDRCAALTEEEKTPKHRSHSPVWTGPGRLPQRSGWPGDAVNGRGSALTQT